MEELTSMMGLVDDKVPVTFYSMYTYKYKTSTVYGFMKSYWARLVHRWVSIIGHNRVLLDSINFSIKNIS